MLPIDPTLLNQILLIVAPLALVFIHQRGLKLPIIEGILNFILNKPAPAKPADPNAPTPPAPVVLPNRPILSALLAAILSRPGGVSNPVGFSVVPVDGQPNAVTVILHAEPAKV